MKTHIELDDALLEQVFQMGPFATKKAAVNAALAEFVKVLKRRELLGMRAKVRWEGDLRALRADRRSGRPSSLSILPYGSITSTLPFPTNPHTSHIPPPLPSPPPPPPHTTP